MKQQSKKVKETLKRRLSGKVSMNSETSEESEGEDEMASIREVLEKKESIINEQTNQIEELKKESREQRMIIRKNDTSIKEKDQELKKVTAIVIEKEELISKMTKKISELGTKDLMTLNKKVVKK